MKLDFAVKGIENVSISFLKKLRCFNLGDAQLFISSFSQNTLKCYIDSERAFAGSRVDVFKHIIFRKIF